MNARVWRLALMASALAGCTHTLTVTSKPAGAAISVTDGHRCSAPCELQLQRPLFSRDQVSISAPGHRTVTFPVRSLVYGPWGSRTKDEVSFVLLPDHGLSGTWTPESEDL